MKQLVKEGNNNFTDKIIVNYYYMNTTDSVFKKLIITLILVLTFTFSHSQTIPLRYTDFDLFVLPIEIGKTEMPGMLTLEKIPFILIGGQLGIILEEKGYLGIDENNISKYKGVGVPAFLWKLTIGDRTIYNVPVLVQSNSEHHFILGKSTLELLGDYTLDIRNMTLYVGRVQNEQSVEINSQMSFYATKYTCNAYLYPNKYSSVLFTIPKGEIVALAEKENASYYKIIYKNRFGYISPSDISFINSKGVTYGNSYTTNSSSYSNNNNYSTGTDSWTMEGCKLRAMPSAIGDVITYISKGSSIKILNYAEAGYYRISYNGMTGYVNKSYIYTGG